MSDGHSGRSKVPRLDLHTAAACLEAGDPRGALRQIHVVEDSLKGEKSSADIEFRGNLLLLKSCALSSQGQYDDASHVLEKLRTTIEAELGPSHTALVSCFFNEAHLFMKMNLLENAKISLKRLVKVAEDIIGPSRSSTIADAYHMLGVVYDMQNNTKGALEYYTKSIQLQEKVAEEDSTANKKLILTLENLAALEREHGRVHDAVKIYTRALRMRKTLLPDDEGGMSHLLYNLGLAKSDLGQSSVADSYFRQSEQILHKSAHEIPGIVARDSRLRSSSMPSNLNHSEGSDMWIVTDKTPEQQLHFAWDPLLQNSSYATLHSTKSPRKSPPREGVLASPGTGVILSAPILDTARLDDHKRSQPAAVPPSRGSQHGAKEVRLLIDQLGRQLEKLAHCRQGAVGGPGGSAPPRAGKRAMTPPPYHVQFQIA